MAFATHGGPLAPLLTRQPEKTATGSSDRRLAKDVRPMAFGRRINATRKRYLGAQSSLMLSILDAPLALHEQKVADTQARRHRPRPVSCCTDPCPEPFLFGYAL